MHHSSQIPRRVLCLLPAFQTFLFFFLPNDLNCSDAQTIRPHCSLSSIYAIKSHKRKLLSQSFHSNFCLYLHAALSFPSLSHLHEPFPPFHLSQPLSPNAKLWILSSPENTPLLKSRIQNLFLHTHLLSSLSSVAPGCPWDQPFGFTGTTIRGSHHARSPVSIQYSMAQNYNHSLANTKAFFFSLSCIN